MARVSLVLGIVAAGLAVPAGAMARETAADVSRPQLAQQEGDDASREPEGESQRHDFLRPATRGSPASSPQTKRSISSAGIDFEGQLAYPCVWAREQT